MEADLCQFGLLFELNYLWLSYFVVKNCRCYTVANFLLFDNMIFNDCQQIKEIIFILEIQTIANNISSAIVNFSISYSRIFVYSDTYYKYEIICGAR